MVTVVMKGKKAKRMRRSRSPKARAILEGAAELILRRGTSAITVDDIARHCRIAKGSVYYYFASRDEILAALLHEGWSEFLAAITSVPESGDPTETFMDTLSALVTAYNRSPRLLAALFPLSQAAGILPPRLLASAERTKSEAYAIIERRLRAAYPHHDHVRLMREIGGLIFGMLRMGREEEPIPVHRVRDAILRLVRT